jgi:hypothetical protein
MRQHGSRPRLGYLNYGLHIYIAQSLLPVGFNTCLKMDCAHGTAPIVRLPLDNTISSLYSDSQGKSCLREERLRPEACPISKLG